MIVDDKRLLEIVRRATKATYGPWRRLPPTRRGGFTFGENEIMGPDGEVVVAWTGFDSADGPKYQRRANARFIAHAAMDIEWLVEQLERERAFGKRLCEELHPTGCGALTYEVLHEEEMRR